MMFGELGTVFRKVISEEGFKTFMEDVMKMLFELEGFVTFMEASCRCLSSWAPSAGRAPFESSETFIKDIVKNAKGAGPALQLGYVTHIENTVSL